MSIHLGTGQKYTILLKTNNISNTIQNRLSVQVSLIGLSFLITNQEDGEVVFFYEKSFSHSTTPEELFFDIETIFAENEVFQKDFEEVAIVYSTPLYSVVPSSLFDKTKVSDYLKFNSKILANDYISHDVIEHKEMVVVYVP